MLLRWKFVWLAGVLLWSPLAFTVLLVVPGSMTLFFAVWYSHFPNFDIGLDHFSALTNRHPPRDVRLFLCPT